VACSITLPPLLPFNTEAAPEAASAIARALGAPDAEAGEKALSRLLREAGHPMRLSALGLGKGDVEALMQNGSYPERMGYNPRPLSREDIKKILMAVF
jgi:alcohol dehydrogenase class IV